MGINPLVKGFIYHMLVPAGSKSHPATVGAGEKRPNYVGVATSVDFLREVGKYMDAQWVATSDPSQFHHLVPLMCSRTTDCTSRKTG